MPGLLFGLFAKMYSEEELSYRDKTWKKIERLIPEALKKDEEKWEKLKKQALKELGQEIRYARSVGKSPFEISKERVDEANRRISQEHKLLVDGYTLNAEDYRTFLYPNLCKFSYFPCPGSVAWGGEAVEDLVYILSSSIYHQSSEAKDKLIGTCDVDAIGEVSRIFRRNYEKLRCAELAGHEEILLTENRKSCEKCKTLCGLHSVQTLLTAYRDFSITFPHEIPCDDTAQYCEGPHLIHRASAR